MSHKNSTRYYDKAFYRTLNANIIYSYNQLRSAHYTVITNKDNKCPLYATF